MASVERCAKLILIVVLLIHCGGHFVNSTITDVRLVGGPTSNKGTVEIRPDNGSWETTCGENLGINDVIVICRQLGFTGANRAIRDTPYVQNSSPTSGLTCIGDKADLSECAVFGTSCSSTAGAASCHSEGYLGCFVDNQNDRVLPGDSLINEPALTISYCIQHCNNSIAGDYKYAGVENGEECYCGEASDNYARLGVGTDINCQVPCTGDSAESCGGLEYIAVFTINIPSPMTPGVTDSVGTTNSESDSTSSAITLITSTTHRQLSSNLPESEKNIGLYAGIGGGVVALIIIVAVIIVVFLIKKRSRGQQKDRFQSHDMTVMPPSSPNGGQDNLYHDMFLDNTDETPNGLQLPDPPPAEADITYYSSVKDQPSPEGDDMYYSSVKDNKSTEEDSKPNNMVRLNEYDGLPDKDEGRTPGIGDAEAMYATADEPGRQSQGEDFSALYAKPDKTGNAGDGQVSEDFGALYALADKTRGVPEGREDVNVGDLYAMPDKSRGKEDQGGLETDYNIGEGLYSLADDDIGPYATSTAPGHTVNPADEEYGTIMVDNELYAI